MMNSTSIERIVTDVDDEDGAFKIHPVVYPRQRIWNNRQTLLLVVLIGCCGNCIGRVDGSDEIRVCKNDLVCCNSRNQSSTIDGVWCDGGTCQSTCQSYESVVLPTVLSTTATVLSLGLFILCCCGLYFSQYGRTLKLKWINRHADALRATEAAARRGNASGNYGRSGEGHSNRRRRRSQTHRHRRDVESPDVPPPPSEIFPNDSSIFRPPDYDDLSITSSEPPKYDDLSMTSSLPVPTTVAENVGIGTANPNFEPEPEEGDSAPVVYVHPLHLAADDPITTTSGSEHVVRVDVARPEVVDDLPPSYDNAVTSSPL